MDAAILTLLALSRMARPQPKWPAVFKAMQSAAWSGRAGVMQQLQGRQSVMSRQQRRLEAERARAHHQAYLERRERDVLASMTGADIERMRQAEAKRRRKAGRK